MAAEFPKSQPHETQTPAAPGFLPSPDRYRRTHATTSPHVGLPKRNIHNGIPGHVVVRHGAVACLAGLRAGGDIS